MRIITANPILTKSNDEFYSLDATSPKSEIKAFQDWLDSKGLKWVKATNTDLTNGSKLNRGGGYGNFGPSTTKAFARYGQEWLATKPTTTSGGGSTTTSGGGSTTTSGDGSNINVGVGEVSGSVETASTKPSLIERFKAMSTTKKVLVVALPIVVVVAVVLIMKRTNK
jgi:hypothetical protein